MANMKDKPHHLLAIARDTIAQEIVALQDTLLHLDDTIVSVTELIIRSEGRLVVTGIGKSAIIAQKIVATMNSTGTPALYMHAADAIHGDLGMIVPEDVVLLLSKSGETPEIRVLVPLLRRMGNRMIAMTASPSSYLASHSDYHLYTKVEQEADPNNLAPTASTTSQIALGDALAMCLLASRGFTADRFAELHPGGSLGKKLYLRVSDILHSDQAPAVPLDASLSEIILAMTTGRVGACAVLDGKVIKGIITDGDLRRMLNKSTDLSATTARDIMTAGGYSVKDTDLAVDALHILETHSINQVIVTGEDSHLRGILHLHELIKEGLV